MQDPKTKLKLLLVIDEAMTLVNWGFFPALRWVLEEVIDKPEYEFLVVFLGTSSRVSNFLPDPVRGSARSLPRGTTATVSPFLGLPWDIDVLHGNNITLKGMSQLRNLIYYGRPLWQSIWTQGSQSLDPRSFIQFAQAKLLCRNPETPFTSEDREKRILEACALLGIRVGLDIDLASPSRASEMVASNMRWLGGVSQDRQKLYTGYGSEPILVEAAATLLNSHLTSFTHEGYEELSEHHSTYRAILQAIIPELNQGYISPGAHGELTTRIICSLS
jgi:hypothetical protein